MDNINIFGIIFILIWITSIGYVLYDTYEQSLLPEYEKSTYSENIIVNDLSVEMYNKSYDHLSIPEKEHVIRVYRIKRYYRETDDTGPDIMPIIAAYSITH